MVATITPSIEAIQVTLKRHITFHCSWSLNFGCEMLSGEGTLAFRINSADAEAVGCLLV